MESSYYDMDVDLASLSEIAEEFFKKKGFRTVRKEEDGGFRILIIPTHIHEIIGKLTVTLSGHQNSFVVKFFSGNRSDVLMKFGRLTSLFGGGIAYLRGVKSQESEERLERKFWVYLEEKMNLLTRTQHTSHT